MHKIFSSVIIEKLCNKHEMCKISLKLVHIGAGICFNERLASSINRLKGQFIKLMSESVEFAIKDRQSQELLRNSIAI